MASDPNRPPQVEAINVLPLNSIPYIDPVASMSRENDYGQGSSNAEASEPAIVFLQSKPTEEQVDNILSTTNNGVYVTGSALGGAFGPLLGKMDIGESDDSYIFRVSLPGVAREDFTCDVAPDGQILIKGVTTTGEKTVYKDSLKFEMLTQNLCPPGHFAISFKLPGPVDSQQLTAHFGIDGVFEGLVKKKTEAN